MKNVHLQGLGLSLSYRRKSSIFIHILHGISDRWISLMEFVAGYAVKLFYFPSPSI